MGNTHTTNLDIDDLFTNMERKDTEYKILIKHKGIERVIHLVPDGLCIIHECEEYDYFGNQELISEILKSQIPLPKMKLELAANKALV